MKVEVVPSTDPVARTLEQRMQDEYVEMYGEPDQDPDNHISGAREVVRATLDDGTRAGIAAWKEWPDGSGKVCLIYTAPEARGHGVARSMLLFMERRMQLEGITYVKFETGPLQHPAMRMYESVGYERLSEGFGFYADNEGSVFYGRWL